MAQVRADPEQIRHFTQVIQDVSDNIEQEFSHLKRAFEEISRDSWQDQHRNEFETELNDIEGVILRFLEQMREQVDPLRHKADVLEDYLRS